MNKWWFDEHTVLRQKNKRAYKIQWVPIETMNECSDTKAPHLHQVQVSVITPEIRQSIHVRTQWQYIDAKFVIREFFVCPEMEVGVVYFHRLAYDRKFFCSEVERFEMEELL